MQLLRSLLFNTYMILSACLFGAFMSLCFWSPHGFQFAIARCWARCLLWVLARLCGLKFTVEGRELHWLPSVGLSETEVDMKALDAALGKGTMRTAGTIAQIAAKYCI